MQLASATSAERTRIGCLDGIRAIAIALVYLHHAEFLALGWVGVTLFFVLSGLLITGILRRARMDRVFWSPFYIKRATRILPPLLIAFAGAAIFCTIPWKRVGLYHLFFLSNIAQTLYRGQSATLDVLWSLSVEEHFYFLWPFAIRFLERRQLIRLLIALLVFEPVLRAAATPMFKTCWPIYFLTPFQLDGLAAGSLLALLLEDKLGTEWVLKWSARVLLPSVVVFLGLSQFTFFEREANTIVFNAFGYSLITLCSVSLIGYVLLRKNAFVSQLLSLRIVIFFGTISYGFYLFHGLGLMLTGKIAIFLHSTDHIRRLIPLTLIPITIFSWLSFRFYETPTIRWGRKQAHALQMSSQLVEDLQ
jgi:peptidoglycan/LPS O-acetylase OafA/YrhL